MTAIVVFAFILTILIIIVASFNEKAPRESRSLTPRLGAPAPSPRWEPPSPRPITDNDAAGLSYYRRDYLLSHGELAFCRALTKIIPRDMVVFPKVRVADLINCSQDDWKAGGSRISTRHVDFVIALSSTTKILMAIELDDRSHLDPTRRDRDYLLDRAFATANLPLLRVPAQPHYAPELLWAQVRDHLHPALSKKTAPLSAEFSDGGPPPLPRS